MKKAFSEVSLDDLDHVQGGFWPLLGWALESVSSSYLAGTVADNSYGSGIASEAYERSMREGEMSQGSSQAEVFGTRESDGLAATDENTG